MRCAYSVTTKRVSRSALVRNDGWLMIISQTEYPQQWSALYRKKGEPKNYISCIAQPVEDPLEA